VNGLEYCTGKEAVVVGKPQKEFFDGGFAALKVDYKDVDFTKEGNRKIYFLS